MFPSDRVAKVVGQTKINVCWCPGDYNIIFGLVVYSITYATLSCRIGVRFHCCAYPPQTATVDMNANCLRESF